MANIEAAARHTMRHGPRSARASAHTALHHAREFPSSHRLRIARERIQAAGTSKKSHASGFTQTLQGIVNMNMVIGPYESYMSHRNVARIAPSNLEAVATAMQEGTGPRPVIDLGPTEHITDADQRLARYLKDLHEGIRDKSVFFPAVAAVYYTHVAADNAAKAERAKLLKGDDKTIRSYEQKSRKATQSVAKIDYLMEQRALVEPEYAKETDRFKSVMQDMYLAELDALALDPRITVADNPKDTLKDKTLTLPSEMDAMVLSVMFQKLDSVREQLLQPVTHAKLARGGRKSSKVTDLSDYDVETTDYTGVLRRFSDFLGFPIRPHAPALVLTTDENRQRHEQTDEAKPKLQMPLPGSDELTLGYSPEVIYVAPDLATRENVSRATAFAYVDKFASFAILGPSQLWNQAREREDNSHSVRYVAGSIESRLTVDIFAAGIVSSLGVQTAYSQRKAENKILEKVYGKNPREQGVEQRQKHLRAKFEALYQARDLLLRAQDAPLNHNTEGNMQQLIDIAHIIQSGAREALGVYFVQSMLYLIDEDISGRQDEAERNKWHRILVRDLMDTPPDKFEDIQDPYRYFQKRKDYHERVEAEVKAREAKEEAKRQRREQFIIEVEERREPKYPFRNLNRIIHWAEERMVPIDTTENPQEMHVPYYYHGSFSPVITPVVIEEYAAHVGGQFTERTAQRVTQALFGIFQQMEASVRLQKRGNEPPGYEQWDQTNLHFIRYTTLQESLQVQSHNGFSLTEMAHGLLTIAQSHPPQHPVFELAVTQEEPLLHEQFLKNWFLGDEPTIAKLGTNNDVGILLSSIRNSLASGTLGNPDGILPDPSDQLFLQSLVDTIFSAQLSITNEPAMDTPSDPAKLRKALLAANNTKKDDTSNISIQAKMTEFERSLPFIESPLQTVEIPGYGKLYGIPSSTDPDPIITPSVVRHYMDLIHEPTFTQREGFNQVDNALFQPSIDIAENFSIFHNPQNYPERYRIWLESTPSLGVVVFPHTYDKESVGFGFRLSHLVHALSSPENPLQPLEGFGPEAHTFLSGMLSDLVFAMQEKQDAMIYERLTGEKPPENS